MGERQGGRDREIEIATVREKQLERERETERERDTERQRGRMTE